MKPIVVIPTYNEKENVAAMAEAVLSVLPSEGMILFCDDNSPDGTGAIIDDLCATAKGYETLASSSLRRRDKS